MYMYMYTYTYMYRKEGGREGGREGRMRGRKESGRWCRDGKLNQLYTCDELLEIPRFTCTCICQSSMRVVCFN